jgi:hypothetical protein
MIKYTILEFIKRRFKKDCNWTSGNCYYFAIILSERFKQHNSVIYYNTLEGHFITQIENYFYDWCGILNYTDEYISKYILKWSDLYNIDQTGGDRIIRDVIL